MFKFKNREKKPLYNIRGHQFAYWLLLIFISLMCIFVLPFGIKAAFCAYDNMPLRIVTQEAECTEDIENDNLGSDIEKNLTKGDGVIVAVGDLSYLSDFLGGFIGVVVGFVLDSLIIERLRQIKRYEAFKLALEKEFKSIIEDNKTYFNNAETCFNIKLQNKEIDEVLFRQYNDKEQDKYLEIANFLGLKDITKENFCKKDFKRIYSTLNGVWHGSFDAEINAPILKNMIESENSADIINIPRYPIVCIFYQLGFWLKYRILKGKNNAKQEAYKKPGEKIFNNLIKLNDKIYNTNKLIRRKDKYFTYINLKQIFNLLNIVFYEVRDK